MGSPPFCCCAKEQAVTGPARGVKTFAAGPMVPKSQHFARGPSISAAQTFDAVVVGAGHNGLTCACYLAAAGLRVKVVERRFVVGGAEVTEEFHPGFRNSVASYTASLLNPKIIRALDLH